MCVDMGGSHFRERGVHRGFTGGSQGVHKKGGSREPCEPPLATGLIMEVKLDRISMSCMYLTYFESDRILITQIAQTDRPDVGPISGNVGRDIGLMSEIISGRYRRMSADIGPTPCLHVGSMSARCRPYRQIWPICPDMLPTSARCRPYRQIWPICPDMLPTSA